MLLLFSMALNHLQGSHSQQPAAAGGTVAVLVASTRRDL